MDSVNLPSGTTPSSLSSVKSKILLATVIVMLAFAAVVSVQSIALNSLKVGGPVFQQINYNKDLIADILPPPEYIIEAYLEATLALRDPKTAAVRQKRLKQLHRDYDDRHGYWDLQPIDKDIKSLLLNTSDAEVRQFWRILESSFLPALEHGNAKAAEDAYNVLSKRYDAHRAIIEKIVVLANADNNKTVSMAASQDTTYFVIVWSVVALIMLLLSGGAYWMMRQIVGPLRTMTSAMGALASGTLDVAIPSLDRKDEIGALAGAMAIFKDELVSAERARQNQSGAVRSIGDGLASLSNGDLTFRMSADFGDAFVKLQQDFNSALERLQNTLGTVLTSTSGITTGAGEISHAADDLSRRTEQQAAALEETAAALEEITATVKKTAENAKEASVIVTKARVAAENGGQIVNTAIQAMGEIENSSKEITDIIGVIEEIAFQTNLLALNAGVEAARAGDSGKGFAVVASEVRTLAQRSSDAARQIKKLITTSAEQVASGVKLVGDSGGALNGIIGQVVEVNALVTEMAQAAQQQSIAIEEVNVAISQMDQVTQQNAAMVEQTTAASHRLASETTDLSDRISFFNVGASGSESKTAEAKAHTGGKARLRAVT